MDDALRRAVLHRLEMLERAADGADPATLLPLARTELPRLTDSWRRLLTTHRVTESGRCSACHHGLRARRWPCPIWRSAHEQLVGGTLPHRSRPH